MNKQPSKFKQFLEKFYWLPPLILVAIVFILVFSLEGLDNVSATLKSWFSPDAKCSACEIIKADKNDNGTFDVLEKDKEKIYVVYYDKDADLQEDVFFVNHVLNAEIKAFNNDNPNNKVTVYSVNYGVKSYSTIAGQTDTPKTFYDKTMTLDIYNKISEDVRVYLFNNGKTTNSQINSYTLTAPVLVEYSKVNGTYEITNVMNNVSEFNVSNVAKFFSGTYED